MDWFPIFKFSSLQMKQTKVKMPYDVFSGQLTRRIHILICERFERALPDMINCDSTDVEFFSQLEVNNQIYYEPVIYFIASEMMSSLSRLQSEQSTMYCHCFSVKSFFL